LNPGPVSHKTCFMYITKTYDLPLYTETTAVCSATYRKPINTWNSLLSNYIAW